LAVVGIRERRGGTVGGVRRFGWLALVALVCGWSTGSASAEPRAFLLMGHESSFRALPHSGSTVATDLARSPAGVAWLAGGAMAVVSSTGVVELVDARGRIHSVARLPAIPFAEARSLSVETAGTLLVTWGGRVWRFDTSGQLAPVTPPENPDGTGFVHSVAPLSDGGFLFTRDPQVFRSWPDGRTEAVAGSGREGDARAGPALQSPLESPGNVVALPAGGFAFTDSGGIVWAVDAAGQMRLLAGGGRADTISRTGSPAASVQLLNISGLRALPDGRVVISTDRGVWAVSHGVIRELVHGPDFRSAPRGFPPLWAGALARRAWVVWPGAVDRNAAGEWLIPTETGIVMVTARDWHASRLAVALSPATLHAVWHRRLEVIATAPASARVRARVGGRVVATLRGRLHAGRTTLRLPRRLPPGVVELDVRAVGTDGAVASHSLRVLGAHRLPVVVVRQSLFKKWQYTGFDTETFVNHCARKSATQVNCTVAIDSEDDTFFWRAMVNLQPDGWLWTTERRRRSRIELV
jgi:hypothetical protein